MINYLRKENDYFGINTYIYECTDCKSEIIYYRLIPEGRVPRCQKCKSKKQNEAFKKKIAADNYCRAMADLMTALSLGAIELPDKSYKELMELINRLIKKEVE